MDETALESYTTPIDDEEADNPIDEFVTFQQVMTSKLNQTAKPLDIVYKFPIFCHEDIATQDTAFYTLLTTGLTPETQKAFQEVMVLAEQKKAQIQSRQIEKQGGM